MKRLTVIAAALIAGCALAGCVSAEKVADAQATEASAMSALDVINTELAGLRADLDAAKAADPDSETVARLVDFINSKTESANEWITKLQAATQTIDQSDGQWGSLENILTAAGAFFPPLGIGAVMVRRGRRMFDGTVASIAAGGGPKDPEAVRAAMSHYPGLKAYVTSTRVKLGDKKLEAVKV